MCLAQITGDDRWLQEPFLPRRDTNLFHDETGGLPTEIQDEVRSNARQVLQELSDNSRHVPLEVNLERFTRMMRVCVA